MEFNRFDVATKELVWDDPVAWLQRLGIDPDGPVEVIDSDVTVLTAAADKVIRVGGLEPFLVNIELQSGHAPELIRTLWFRQVAIDHRRNLPVLTVLVLLRKDANSPSLTGVYERFLPDGRLTNRSDYQVLRLWKEPADSFLNAGIELVPLAPLADLDEQQLPELVRKMAARINPLPKDRADKLWLATYLLMGLRYPVELADQLLEGTPAVSNPTAKAGGFPDQSGTIAGQILRPSVQFRPTYLRPAPTLAGREFSKRLAACLKVDRFTHQTVSWCNQRTITGCQRAGSAFKAGAPGTIVHEPEAVSSLVRFNQHRDGLTSP